MPTIIRFARRSDTPGILEFYGPLVADTVISFETEPLTLARVEDRMRTIQADYPW